MLFPNPASENNTIQNDFLSTRVGSISISDAAGKKVWQKTGSISGSMNEIFSVENLALEL